VAVWRPITDAIGQPVEHDTSWGGALKPPYGNSVRGLSPRLLSSGLSASFRGGCDRLCRGLFCPFSAARYRQKQRSLPPIRCRLDALLSPSNLGGRRLPREAAFQGRHQIDHGCGRRNRSWFDRDPLHLGLDQLSQRLLAAVSEPVAVRSVNGSSVRSGARYFERLAAREVVGAAGRHAPTPFSGRVGGARRRRAGSSEFLGRWADQAPQQRVLDRLDDDGEDLKHRANRSMTNLGISFSHMPLRVLCPPRADPS